MKPILLLALLSFAVTACKHTTPKGNAEGYGARREAPPCKDGKTPDGKPCK